MGRHSLRIIFVVGLLITAMGGTGIFAVFSDRATTGDNSVTSGSRPRAADLQINLGVDDGAGGIDCYQDLDRDGVIWSDDLTTGIFSAQSLQPGVTVPAGGNRLPGGPTGDICLQNAGAAALDVTASVIDLIDGDIDCTGDEVAADDATCGLDPTNLAPQLGELSPLLTLTVVWIDCTIVPAQVGGGAIFPFASYSAPVISLPASGLVCLRYSVNYPSNTPEAAAQVAQSDQVTWRFAFDGTAQ